jgi:hypothetical protein
MNEFFLISLFVTLFFKILQLKKLRIEKWSLTLEFEPLKQPPNIKVTKAKKTLKG